MVPLPANFGICQKVNWSISPHRSALVAFRLGALVEYVPGGVDLVTVKGYYSSPLTVGSSPVAISKTARRGCYTATHVR